MNSPGRLTAAALALVLVGLLLWWWQPWHDKGLAPLGAASAPVATPIMPPSAPQAPASAVLFPLQPASAASAGAAAPIAHTDAALESAVIDLAGRKGVLSLLQMDGFVHRLVATVDNLDRPSAPTRVWPVNPAPGRFEVLEIDGKTTIAPDNGLRYAPIVQLVESVKPQQAVDLYRQLYPWFQQSYEELGYPQRYFNDRLVAVIDHLLSTPEPAQPIAVTLVEIKGPYPSARPWVHYQFTDPALEQASAGQKMLMRMGAVNERRLKAWLAQVRLLLTQGTPPR